MKAIQDQHTNGPLRILECLYDEELQRSAAISLDRIATGIDDQNLILKEMRGNLFEKATDRQVVPMRVFLIVTCVLAFIAIGAVAIKVVFPGAIH